MRIELERELYKKYPKIFRQKDLSMKETCMCWGIECGDGWYKLIDDLCRKVQKYIDEHDVEQVEAIQVKEKFGGLRFYVCYAVDKVRKMIDKAEIESYKTCEECGSRKGVKQTEGGWVSTLCKKCMKKLEEEREEQRKKYEEERK